MAIELFLNSISSKYQKLAVGWADVEFCKIADNIKKVYNLYRKYSVIKSKNTVNVHVSSWIKYLCSSNALMKAEFKPYSDSG